MSKNDVGLNYTALAASVIFQACEDYIYFQWKAPRVHDTYKANKYRDEVARIRKDILSPFFGEYLAFFNMEGKTLLERLDKRVQNGKKGCSRNRAHLLNVDDECYYL